MDGKIKFGFSKVIKKTNLVNHNGEAVPKANKIEMIEAIEGSSIKISGKNPEDDIEKKLVIPMTNDQKTTPLAKLLQEKTLKKLRGRGDVKLEPSEIKIEQSNGNSVVPMETDIKQEPIEETLEQQAARELVEDLQNKAEKTEVKIFEVPMNADELPLDGAKESSIDDYDRVPIGDFGKAMLRGMGWKDEEVKEDTKALMEGPILRPKGMGLGADKVIKKQPLLIAPNQSETLEIKRNACIKILAGKHKNMYGTIEGFDDGGGRIIVRLAIGGLKMTMNEFMVQAVGKAEFAKYGKILNSEKYEEFKAGGDGVRAMSAAVAIKQEPESSKPRRERTPERRQRRQSRSPERHRKSSRDRSRSREKERERDRSGAHKSKSHRYENSSDVRKYRGRSRSRSKHSSSDERSHKKKSSKNRSKHHSSPDSRNSSDERKHTKKSKKSKQRKRDRS